ncbi:MAG TPA: hypothetical protein VFG97_00430 [Pedococcus sp.]|nr:hypothetical protein [Pedococcus sp.]
MSGGSGVQTLSHPSRQFPGPPAVAVETPAEWSAVRVPGTLLAARRTSEGFVAPDVVVRGFTRSGRFTIGRALGELHGSDADAEYPKVHQVVQSVRVTR